ncbi:MAG: ABC transporter ATP-binding protein [Candidatus Lindowbacteria bacterium]|nr:ABC transporter ATP-binding protein [Candidatus Lindowbacteria bacterium]
MESTPLFEALNISSNSIIDFSIRLIAGESVGVVGASGSGKSTLLRILGDLLPSRTGKIYYDGAPTTAMKAPAFRRCVSYLPQLPGLMPGTVKENLEKASTYSVNKQSCGEFSVSIEEALETAGLDNEFRQRDAARLSVGEKARVSLARLLVSGPAVLLLDEPTAALDEANSKGLLSRLISMISKTGQGMILASHDPVALSMCNRTIEL